MDKFTCACGEEFDSFADLEHHVYNGPRYYPARAAVAIGVIERRIERRIECKEARIADNEDLCTECGDNEKEPGLSICRTCNKAGDPNGGRE